MELDYYETYENDIVQPKKTYYDVAAVFEIDGVPHVVTTTHAGDIYIVDLKTNKYVNEFKYNAPLSEPAKRVQGFDQHSLYRFESVGEDEIYTLTKLNLVEEAKTNLGNALFDSRTKFGNIEFVTSD